MASDLSRHSHTNSESVEEFNRPPRRYPELSAVEFRIAQPPVRSARPQRFNPFTIFAPVIFLAIPAISLLQSGSNTLSIALTVLILTATATISVALGSLWWERRSQQLDDNEQAEAYKILLNEQATELKRLLEHEKSIRQALDPSLVELLPRVTGRTKDLWERRPNDPDFLTIRVGIGTDLPPLSIKIIVPEPVGAPLLLNNPRPNATRKKSQSAVVKQLPAPETQTTTLFDLARQQVRLYQALSDVPLTVNLPAIGTLGLVNYTVSAALLRAMLLQIVTHHAPDEVRIAAVITRTWAAGLGQALNDPATEWDWLRLLPHTRPLRADAHEPMVVIRPQNAEDAEAYAQNLERLMTGLLDELSQREQNATASERDPSRPLPPYLILLLIGDTRVVEHIAVGYILRQGSAVRASAICLVDNLKYLPSECGATIDFTGAEFGQYTRTVPGGSQTEFRRVTNEKQHQVDEASVAQCQTLAEAMQNLRLRATTGAGDLRASIELMEVLKINLESYNPAKEWKENRLGRFRTIIGEEPGGKLREFDLVEHGPHGLIAGTSGSGKSKLLLSLILGLALTHNPQDLNFVLVDYKGGGDLGIFQHLPHTVGLITNLQGRLAERALHAFTAELRTRQRAFARAGASDLASYEQRRQEENAETPRFARTLIVIDEFAQLAQELPDFMARLLSIAQIGRSLGIHLLLATQRPAGVVTPGIAANINYRLCLRVVSLEESRDVLGRPEAALLPYNRPGRAYFQIGQTTFALFQTARVDIPYNPNRPLPPGLRYAKEVPSAQSAGNEAAAKNADLVKPSNAIEMLMSPQTLQSLRVGPPQITEIAPSSELDVVIDVPVDATEAQVVVALLQRHAQVSKLGTVRGPWSDPLPNNVALPSVFRMLQTTPPVFSTAHQSAANIQRGSDIWDWPILSEDAWLQAPIGLIDDIEAQCHIPLMVDFYRGGTHMLISGAAGSGKSNLVRTIITSLTLTHHPGSLWCYLIDFSGLALNSLKALPHIGEHGLFQPSEPARIRRLLRWLRTTLDERKHTFGEAGQSDLWAYRRKLRELGKSESVLPGAIVLVIDNLAGFREIFDDEMQTIIAIARDGKSAGIHLVLTADRPSALPAALTSNIEAQIVLRLNDPTESGTVLNKPDAAQIDPATPGRGFRRAPALLEVQIALVAAMESEDARNEALDALGMRMRDAANNYRLPDTIQLLKEYIPLDQLAAQSHSEAPLFSGGRHPVVIACDDQTLRPIAVDLERDGPHMLITGSKGSGKSILIRTWATALSTQAQATNDLQIALVGFQRSLRPLRKLPGLLDNGYVEQPAQLRLLTNWLRDEYQRRRDLMLKQTDLTASQLGPSIVIFIDDYDMVFAEAEEEIEAFGEVAKGSRDLGIHFVVASNVEEMGRYYHSFAKALKAIRAGVLLRVNEPGDGLVLGVRLPYDMRVTDTPQGRGYLVTAIGQRLVQCAVADRSA